MAHQVFVVRLSQNSDAYLTGYSMPAIYDNCIWGNVDFAFEFATLADAQNFAASIGGGTVGTTKP